MNIDVIIWTESGGGKYIWSDAEKAIDEIQYPVMIKTLSKFKIGGSLLEIELPSNT